MYLQRMALTPPQTDGTGHHVDSCICSDCTEDLTALAERITANHLANISKAAHKCREQVDDLDAFSDFPSPKDAKVVQMVTEKTMKPSLEIMLAIVHRANTRNTSIHRRRKKEQNSFARYQLGGVPVCALSMFFCNICMYEPALAKMGEFAPQLLSLYQIMLTAALEHPELTELNHRGLFRANDEEDNFRGDSSDTSSDDDDDDLDFVPWLVLWGIHNTLMTMKARRLLALLGEGHPKLPSFGHLLMQMLKKDNVVTTWFGLRMALYVAEVGGPDCVAQLEVLGMKEAVQTILDKARSYWQENTGLKNKESDFVSCLLRHASLVAWELQEPGKVNYYKSQNRLDRLATKHDHDECIFSPRMLREDGLNMDVVCSSPICFNSERDAPARFGACARCRMARYCSVECQRIHWFDSHKEFCCCKKDILTRFKRTIRTTADSK
ncbi:Hypp2530 [Branchiostoma lanceolatum]|uniref:Hypp2530 protein n=1 Tax=Branchiostoma lanceolatum TaxID=7740 RepID=A0A8J9ZUI3_BRALA|nr:Hypp2530 [Branchiostoma lanceolatum]